MQIDVTEKEDILNVAISGKMLLAIDSSSRKEIEELLKIDKNINLDLGDVTAIDSTGLGLLLNIKQTQKKRGKELYFTNISEEVYDVIEVTGIIDYFNIH
jgi:anti-sigma B factor antagonist